MWTSSSGSGGRQVVSCRAESVDDTETGSEESIVLTTRVLTVLMRLLSVLG